MWVNKNAVLELLGCRVQLLNILGCVCIKMNFTETFINHSCQRKASQVIEQHCLSPLRTVYIASPWQSLCQGEFSALGSRPVQSLADAGHTEPGAGVSTAFPPGLCCLSQPVGGSLLLPPSLSLPEVLEQRPERALGTLPHLSTASLPSSCTHGKVTGGGEAVVSQAGHSLPFLQNSSNRNYISALPLFPSGLLVFFWLLVLK